MSATTVKSGVNGDGQNGWTEYRRLVLAELERLSSAVSAGQVHGNNLQLTTSQAISDAKHHLLDKLRDTVKTIDDDWEKKLKDLETRHDKAIAELKKDADRTDKQVKKTHTELTSLKAKALTLGAIAGFLVAAGGLAVNFLLKK